MCILDFINCKRSLLIASAACFCLKFLTWGQNRIDPAGRSTAWLALREWSISCRFFRLRDRDFLLVFQGKMAKNRDIFLREVTTPVPHDKLSPENLINAEITVRGPILGLLNNCTLLDFSGRFSLLLDTSRIFNRFWSGLGVGLYSR